MTHPGLHIVTKEDSHGGQPESPVRLASAGLLTAGGVHDLNNLLGILVGYCAELTLQQQVPEPARILIAEIEKAVEAARTVAGGLLAVSRGPCLPRQPIDLNDIVHQTGAMLTKALGRSVTLVERLGVGLGSIEALPGQLEQILINLILNARDAMPNGGRLSIETANVTFAEDYDQDYLRQHPNLRAGSYVRLSVTDTGCGMDAETQARAFETFFTTKPLGQGTGLGLATVAAIVKNSGGHIVVDTGPGMGTTFHVFFPRARNLASVAPQPFPLPVPMVERTILLVEDSPSLRALTRRILERAGYRVLEAAHAADALRLVHASTSSIALLVTDVHLPGIGGPELAQKVAAMHPDTKVLFTSGHRNGPEQAARSQTTDHAYLDKPFTRERLLGMVEELLHRGEAQKFPSSTVPPKPPASQASSVSTREGGPCKPLLA